MRNRRLEAVAFLATLLVVMCHADDVLPPDRMTCLSRFFGTYFSAGDTPNFFCLSGYFLALRYGCENWWLTAIKKRIRTLVVPYLLWGGLLFGICLVCSLTLNGTQAQILSVFRDYDGGVSRIFGLRFVGGPMACGPLWYVKTICYFVIVSPMVFALIRWRWWSTILLVSGCLAFDFLTAGSPVLQGAFHHGFSLVGFASFIVGATFALHPVKLECMRSSPCLAIASLFGWIAVAVFAQCSGSRCELMAWMVYVMNVAVAVTALQLMTIGWRFVIPGWLSSLTFFIYVTHVFFLQNVCKFFADGGYFLVLATTLLLCVFTGSLFRRMFPRLFGVLTGGRG